MNEPGFYQGRHFTAFNDTNPFSSQLVHSRGDPLWSPGLVVAWSCARPVWWSPGPVLAQSARWLRLVLYPSLRVGENRKKGKKES
jgi:hypothetical protein